MAMQGTLTYVGQPNYAGQVIIVLRIDLGYPVETLLFSGATLLAIAFDPVSGLLTTNTRCQVHWSVIYQDLSHRGQIAA